MANSLLLALVVGVLGLVWVALTARRVLAHPQGNDEMIRIGTAIREGAQAFLRAEYRVIIVFALVVALIIAGADIAVGKPAIGVATALAYIAGAFTSALTGFIGMSIATRANTRAAAAAMISLDKGLRVAFGAGSVMGMSVVSVGLIGLSVCFLIFGFSIDWFSC